MLRDKEKSLMKLQLTITIRCYVFSMIFDVFNVWKCKNK